MSDCKLCSVFQSDDRFRQHLRPETTAQLPAALLQVESGADAKRLAMLGARRRAVDQYEAPAATIRTSQDPSLSLLTRSEQLLLAKSPRSTQYAMVSFRITIFLLAVVFTSGAQALEPFRPYGWCWSDWLCSGTPRKVGANGRTNIELPAGCDSFVSAGKYIGCTGGCDSGCIHLIQGRCTNSGANRQFTCIKPVRGGLGKRGVDGLEEDEAAQLQVDL